MAVRMTNRGKIIIDVSKIPVSKLKNWIEGLLSILCEETNIHKVSWYLFSTDRGDVRGEYSHDLGFPGYPSNGLRIYLGKNEVEGKMILIVALGTIAKKLSLKGKFSNVDKEDDMHRIIDLSAKIHAQRKVAGIKLRQPLSGVTI